MGTAEHVILIRYGEIALKSEGTRRRFEEQLLRNIRHVFQQHDIQHDLQWEWGRIYLYTDKMQDAAGLLQTIFGIVSFSLATKYVGKDISKLSRHVAEYCEDILNERKSFAVRARRTGNHSFTSQDVAIKAGDEIRKATGANVDLDNPDVEVFVEVRENESFVFTKKIRGPGGLPLGTQGRVAIVIDTPYSIFAGWLLMKRGCDPLFVVTNDEIEERLRAVMKQWNVSLDNRVITFQFKKTTDASNALVDIAEKHNCDAVATGEYLEADEQELWPTTRDGSFLFLRPLISFKREEIKQKCEEIGVF